MNTRLRNIEQVANVRGACNDNGTHNQLVALSKGEVYIAVRHYEKGWQWHLIPTPCSKPIRSIAGGGYLVIASQDEVWKMLYYDLNLAPSRRDPKHVLGLWHRISTGLAQTGEDDG